MELSDERNAVLARERARSELRPRKPAAVTGVLLALLLAACGGGGGGAASPDASSPAGVAAVAPAATGGQDDFIPPSTEPGPDGGSDPSLPGEPDESASPPPSDTPGSASDVTGTACDANEPRIRLASRGSPNALPDGVLASRIADGVACVDVLPDGFALGARGVLDALTSGELEIAVVLATELAERLPEYAVFDLPYLFEGISALTRFQSGEGGAALLQATTRDGVRPLGFVNTGLVQTSADREIFVPGDLAGTKITGSDSPLFRAQYEALDAAPIRLAPGERYGALLAGTVDAQESPWSVADASRYPEVQPFFTQTDHRAVTHVLLVAADWWSALDPDARTALERLFTGALAETEAEARDREASARAAVIGTGVGFRALGADERAAFVEAMRPVWRSVEDAIGVDLIGFASAANSNGSGTPTSPPSPSAAHPAETVVVDSTDALLRALRDGRPTGAGATDLERIIGSAFDLETMTRLAVGAGWRDADAEQQARLVDAFGTLFSTAYADALTAYREGTLQLEPFVPQSRTDRAEIRSTLVRTGEPTRSLVHSLRERDGWTVFDVEIDGTSLVVGYRSAFAAIIDRGGIDALIDEITRLNADR